MKEAYKDLLRPTGKQIGEILGNTMKVARFIFAPIDYGAKLQDKFQNFLKKVENKVPEEKCVEASPQISGPIIESMVYMDENSLLGEMFANLLACAIHRERQDKAHPAFPKIIQQLSHDEAIILFYLKKNAYAVEQRWNLSGDKIINTRTTKEEFPVDKLSYPEHIWMYMSHLNSYDIAGSWKKEQDHPLYENNQQIGGVTTSHRKLTDFGELFAKACVPDSFDGI